MNKDNRGVTLVELIVVIAIMAIMVGVGALSVSLLFGTQAKGCAEKVSSMLNETKTGCLSRFDETMTLTYHEKKPEENIAFNADGYYAINKVYTLDKDENGMPVRVPVGNDDSAEIRNVGSSKVVITVYLSDAAEGYVLGQDKQEITISYKRSTGAFDPVIVDGVQTTQYVDRITFSSGARTYTITMEKETGKHKLEG